MSNPDEIRRDIERTRAELSDNVNALGDSAKPGNIVRSQVDEVKQSARSLKERVFGSPYDPYDHGTVGHAQDRAAGVLHDAQDRAAGLVHDAGEAVSEAPQRVESGTRGNPLAAGLIAAGVGALIGGLIPASRFEKEKAVELKDKAEPLVEEVKQLANEAKDNLQPLATDAVDSVKGTAQTAADAVKADANVAKDEVVDQAKSSAENVKSDAQGAVDDTKAEVDQKRNDTSTF